MDAIFKALSDSTRRRLLDRLFERPGQTLTELIEGLDMRRQSAAKHIAILEDAGLISCQWQGVPDNDLMTLEISTGRSMKDVFGTIRYKDEVDATMQTLI